MITACKGIQGNGNMQPPKYGLSLGQVTTFCRQLTCLKLMTLSVCVLSACQCACVLSCFQCACTQLRLTTVTARTMKPRILKQIASAIPACIPTLIPSWALIPIKKHWQHNYIYIYMCVCVCVCVCVRACVRVCVCVNSL